MEEKIIVVDAEDQIIGSKPRSKVTDKDIYRVSALTIFNKKGQVLLAQRKLTKEIEPGSWGPAAAGTNAEGETYESNLYKETKEEIGLDLSKFKIIRLNTDPVLLENHFIMAYRLQADIDIQDLTLQDEEVESVAWWDVSELESEIEKNPGRFVRSAPYWKDLGWI